MTPQEFFTRTLEKIRAQGGPAVRLGIDGPSCAYRDDNGRGCAIGVHLPEDVARSLTQTTRVTVGRASRAFHDVVGREPGDFEDAVQAAHDSAALERRSTDIWIAHNGPEFFERWEPKMQALATEYGLEYTPPATEGGVL
jgi:hypothetical protein